MGALDRILERTVARGGQRAWPVGHGSVQAWETQWGHDDSRFAPESNELYVTQNDVYSLLADRSRLMAGLTLRFYKGEGTKKKEVESGRAPELYRHVNPFWTASRLARMDEMSMGVWGETYWAIEPPSKASPLGEIWWLKASQVSPAPHPDKYVLGYWYEPLKGGQRIWFDANELIWFRYPNPIDEFSALPPLTAAKLAADTANAMMTSNRQLFSQGMQIAGLVTPTNPELVFSETQADDLETYLKKRFTGPDKAHRWAVLRHEAKFAQMSMTPKDAEFVSGLNMTFRQVCRAFGMQPTLHGDLEQASPGDTDALERVEWARTLKPDAQFRAEEIREQYLPKFVERGAPDHCEFDFSQVPALQESQSEVWSRDISALDRGLITINEWRLRNGLPEVEWGEAPWLPLNKAQYIDGKLVVPGQNDMPGMMGDPSMGGLPQDAMQGGPVPADEEGVPYEILPDDEVNPVNQPERSHWRARQYLAQGDVQEFLTRAFQANGHKPVGVR